MCQELWITEQSGQDIRPNWFTVFGEMKYEIKSIRLEKEIMEQVFFFLKNQLVILEVKKNIYGT